ncbi:MAG: XRE family transcriptional regulator [Pseudomonas sp.]
MIWEMMASSPEEAQELRQRARLLCDVLCTVHGWEVSRKEAAERLQLTQRRVDDLLKGKIERFTLPELVQMAVHANVPIAATISA